MNAKRLRARPRSWLAALLLALGPAGCGGTHTLYPVDGRVTLDDGFPMSKGVVVFEPVKGGPAVAARGEIKKDGIYQMSTYKPGDGVPAGTYRVQINPLDLSDVPDEEKKLPFDAKYLRFDTSGLVCEVKPEKNLLSFKLAARPPAAEKPKDEPTPKGEAKPK